MSGAVDPSASAVAWVFPGQGSQTVGMGRALYEAYPEIRDLYDSAAQILGYSLSDVCFNGPADKLQQTIHAQPALLVTELAHLTALHEQEHIDYLRPRFVAGHSLGEYVALVAAEVLSFEDALRLVAERGRLMQEAGAALGKPTGMAAVLGLDTEQLAPICEAEGVDIANFNAPGQVVISGPLDALDAVGTRAKEAGARRIMPLQVSAAFHSRWMKPMSEEFARMIAETAFNEPQVPVVANVIARPAASAAEIRTLLQAQTYSPVRWTESVQYMVANGTELFVEIGPGKVLGGLIKRVAPEAQTLSSEEMIAQAG